MESLATEQRKQIYEEEKARIMEDWEPKKMPAEVSLLQILAILNFFGAGFLAVLSFTHMTEGEHGPESVLNIALTVAALAEALLGSLFLFCISRIIESLVNIENGINWQNWHLHSTSDAEAAAVAAHKPEPPG